MRTENLEMMVQKMMMAGKTSESLSRANLIFRSSSASNFHLNIPPAKYGRSLRNLLTHNNISSIETVIRPVLTGESDHLGVQGSPTSVPVRLAPSAIKISSGDGTYSSRSICPETNASTPGNT